MDNSRLNKTIVTVTMIVLYVYLALFGIALSFSAFVRAASPFYFDMITEIALSVIGAMLAYGMISVIVGLVQKKKVEVSKWKRNSLIAAVVITLIVSLFEVFGLLRPIPSIIQLVLTGGFQIAAFFNKVISSVFVGKFDLAFIRPFFEPINWLFGVVYWVLILGWFWPEKKKK